MARGRWLLPLPLVLALGGAALGTLASGPPAARAEGCGGWLGAGDRLGWWSADQRFIVMMIPHHEGAIAAAGLAELRARRPEIRALARRIRESQERENAQLRRWYRQWYGEAVPVVATCGGMGMGMGWGVGLGDPAAAAASLKTAADPDRAFIVWMIPHHRMGVHMAAMAQARSGHPELLKLQQEMVRVQSAEIEQMEGWYRSWYGGPP